MTIEMAVKLLNKYYDKALAMQYIKDPVAWALYQTWKEADRR